MSEPKKLFLLDAYALIFRSYYAFIKNPRINSKGFNTSAVFGFMLTLDEIIQKQKPTHIAVAFDPPSPTFRHTMYSDYKANRDATPEDIKLSVPYIKAILKAYGIPILEVDGFEADDVIGTMAWKASERGFVTYMMTPDKDFAQLVRDNVFMFKPARGGNEPDIWGPTEVKSEFLVKEPIQVIDVLALMGDTADNIPGAPGIGPKTAKKLISEYGTVEKLLENTINLKGKQKEILESSGEQVLFAKKLVTIETNVDIEFDEEMLLQKEPDREQLLTVYNDLEFRTLAAKIGAVASEESGTRRETKSTADPLQGSLFGTEEVAPHTSFETAESIEHSYSLIEKRGDMEELARKLQGLEEFCFDTETTSIDALESEIVAMSFSWEKGRGYLVPFPEDRGETDAILEIFRGAFEDKKIRKIGQNIKYDIQVLGNYGIDVNGELFDTMIAHYLLEPDMRHNMDYLAETYLNYRPISIETLIGERGKSQRTMRSVEVEKITEYAVEDADITYQLKSIFSDLLKEQELDKLAQTIEMPLIPVLADMERAGVELNEAALKDYAVILREDIIKLEQEIYDLAGVEFNISSPKQLGDILFLRLKLDDKARKTKTKQFVTNEEVLQRLTDRHPIIEKVLEYRGLKKLLSTYVEALPALVNQRTKRIHTSYNQAVASTGRLSSNNPNLQNIPVRDDRGREIRKAFIPSEGKLFLSADYSQIELRLMAHMSGDKSMIDDFRSGEDIHSATAAKIFGIDASDVTREMRGKAKTANFGIIYGISAYGLSQRLNISRSEAKELIDGYFNSYAGVKGFMDESIRVAREKSYVTTMFGRRRYLRDINSRNSLLRSNAERNAINAPIQGSAADIIKIAMIDIYYALKSSDIDARMILQVHDELIFEVADGDVDRLRKLVTTRMESAAKLDIPLIVDSGTGYSWLEAH
jgi:DNA polymerase-1